MQSDHSAPVVKHPVETKPEDALKYWTADKMRNARATNMPHVKASRRKKKHEQEPPHPSHAQPD